MLSQALLPTLTCGRGQVDFQATGTPHSCCCHFLPDPQEVWGRGDNSSDPEPPGLSPPTPGKHRALAKDTKTRTSESTSSH